MYKVLGCGGDATVALHEELPDWLARTGLPSREVDVGVDVRKREKRRGGICMGCETEYHLGRNAKRQTESGLLCNSNSNSNNNNNNNRHWHWH